MSWNYKISISFNDEENYFILSNVARINAQIKKRTVECFNTTKMKNSIKNLK